MSASSGIALVTGAAGGIGAAVVRRLAGAGWQVAALDLDAAGLARLAEGSEVLTVVADVTDEGAIRAAFDRVRAEWGDPTAVVNVAGYFDTHTVADLSRAAWDLFLAVNATGPFLVCREALPAMLRAGGGSIVNVASTAGLRGGRHRAAYCAAKGAPVLFSRSLAIDHGHDGVRVNVVAPGLIDTPMADWIRHDPAAMAGFEAELPLGRIGRPEDVAGTVAYLLSAEAAFVTGATYTVDGGSSA